MKIHKLIDILSRMNPDLEVVVPGNHGDYKDPELYEGSNTFYRPRGETRCYSGLRHEDDEEIIALVLA